MKKILYFLVLASTCVIMTFPVRAFASTGSIVGDTDASFAEEGARAYDELKRKIDSDTREAFENIQNGNSSVNILGAEDIVRKGWIAVFYAYDVIKSILPFFLSLCWVIGPVIYFISRKNKKIQKFALGVITIALPLIAIAYVYFMPSLYLHFN